MKARFLIILCFAALQSSAQFNLELHMGYGSYLNNDLKKNQASLANDIAGAEVLESFPSFWYYGVNAKWNLPKAQIGLSLTQGSTGGQVYYADYSGTFKEQQLLKYTSARMITASKILFNKGNTLIQIDPGLGLVFATLEVNRSANATDGIETFNFSQSHRFKAVNPFSEPTLSLSQKVGVVGINIFIGYHFDLATSIFRESNGQPLTYNGNETTMDLSGVRIGGSFGVYLGRTKEIDFTRIYIGLGTGIDFGGFGLNAMCMLNKYVGLFGAAGYNLNNIGLNGGVRLYSSTQSTRWRPFFSAMYGYNTVYYIKDANNFNRTFYGPTIGVGVDLKDARSNFWTLALQIPFRNDDVKAYKTYLENSNIEIKRDLLPVTFSLGYRFAVEN